MSKLHRIVQAKSRSFPVSCFSSLTQCQPAGFLKPASQMEPMKIQMSAMDSLKCLIGEPMNVSTKSFKSIEKRLKIVGHMVREHGWLTQDMLCVLFPMDNIVTFSKRQWELMALDARSILKHIEGYLF